MSEANDKKSEMEFEYQDTKHQIKVEDLIDGDKFVGNVLSKVFMHSDECGICYEEFDANNLGGAVYLNCNCKLGYHNQCINAALESNKSCPQCRRPNPVVIPFKGNVQDLGVYEEFYDKANAYLEPTTRLRFIHNWFAPVKNKASSLRRSCLVNPFEYMDYTKHDTEFKDSGLYRDLNNLHINPVDQTSFQVGQQTMRSQEEFVEEFNKVTQGFFTQNGWSWENLAICGGMVGKLMSGGTKYYPESSDFDIYVYGKDSRDREDTIRRVVKFFGNHKAWFLCRNSVIDIFIPGFPRNFQIIAGNFGTVDDILYSFDLSHIQAAIVGPAQVLVTPEFLAAQKYQITQIDESKFKMKRILKIIGTGMSLASKRDIGDIAMFIKDRRNGHYVPGPEEDAEHVIAEFSAVYGISIDQITRDPAKCIHLIKTDTNMHNAANYADNMFLLDPKRFASFDKLKVRQTGRDGFYLFRFEYPNLPRFIMEVHQVKLNDITGTDSSGRRLSVDTLVTNEEDKDIIGGFVQKLKEFMLEYVKDKPWIKLNSFLKTRNIYFNNYPKNGTRVYQNNKLVDNQYFINKGLKGQMVDAVIVLNGIRCGYQATNGTVELSFQEIRYKTT